MGEDVTTVPTDWKARYLELAQQQATERASAEDTEKLLCRIIIRLTLATGGLDPALDPHLTALRNSVRKGVRLELKERLAEISEALIRANDEPAASQPSLVSRLVDRSGLSGREAEKVRKLGDRLVAEGDSASDEQIDRFLHMLSRPRERGSSPGLLRRLFASSDAQGDSPAAAQDDANPNQLLLQLLERLNWPAQLSLDIQRLELELSSQKEGGRWIEVLNSLVSLLSRSLGEVQSEIKDTRGFLEELTQRLVQIDQHVIRGFELREASCREGESLDLKMQQEMGDMRRNMDGATTLQQLRGEIGRHLDTIEQHLGSFVKGEKERHEEASQLEEHLRKRLDEVQNESRELRQKMLEAHRQAATDTVTGLPNRLAYEDRLDQEFARWKRFGDPLSLLVWDVDDFKRINDRFGHHAGDKALRIIGQSLQQGLRETDFVARFGGEEFVMLLPGTDSDFARQVAESARVKARESGIHSVGNRVEVTISCGLSEFKKGDGPADVFARADRALYEAKRAGKDRVIVR
ncbi:MAG: GGDEF domain-containing protein [Sedimenticola sp.]|nr:GGDEF domain-containing protein [Sedimenticola sp.]